MLYEELENSISMTGMCETEDAVFFGTISIQKADGCDLYRYDKGNKNIEKCTHFYNKGIYALAYDGKDSVIVSTSGDIAVYAYHTGTGEIKTIQEGFCNECFVRSMTYKDGFAYLGIGTSADFIQMDTETGEYKSILPEQYKSNTFIYDQYIADESIYLLISPSCEIIEYRIDDNVFKDAGIAYVDNNNGKLFSEKMRQRGNKVISLLGNLIFYRDHNKLWGRVQFGNLASCFNDDGTGYGLDASGLIHIWDAETGREQVIDLYNYIDAENVIPVRYMVYDDKIYISERRFSRYGLTGEQEKIFLVNDEPQACFCNENGIYTANYTECTVYYYPWAIFHEESYSVDMNSSEFLLTDIIDQCRPFDLQVTRDQRYLLIASGPMYGDFGGAISMYDLRGSDLVYSDIHVIKDETISEIALSSFENCVWLGTSDFGENTYPAYIEASPHLLLWNYLEERIVMDIQLDKEDLSIGFIAEKDGFVYCLTHYGEMRIYDVADGKEVYRDHNSWRNMLLLRNGCLIAGTDTGIYRIYGKGNQRAVCDGFCNLSGIVQDQVSGYVYAFEGDQMIKISGCFLNE